MAKSIELHQNAAAYIYGSLDGYGVYGAVSDFDSLNERLSTIQSYLRDPVSEYLGTYYYGCVQTSWDTPSPPCLSVPSCHVQFSNDVSTSSNCTSVCSGEDLSSLFFGSNLMACLLISVLAKAVQNGTYTLNMTQKTQDTIAAYAIPDLATFDPAPVLRATSSCMVSSCATNGLGTCNSVVTGLKTNTTAASTFSGVMGAIGSYCSGGGSIVNQDIAGPGVLVSYLLQIGLALAFSALLGLLTSWLKPVFWLLFVRSGPPNDVAGFFARPWRRSRRLQHSWARARPAAALISSLVEFQEIQGYFIAAIQMATLFTFAGGVSSRSNVNSFGMALFNADIVQTLSVQGVLPVLLVQTMLQHAGMKWWYTLGITSLVFVLAIVIEFTAQDLSPNYADLWKYLSDNQGVDECGGNPSPMTYCMRQYDTTARGNLNALILGSSNRYDTTVLMATTYAVLLVDQLVFTVTRRWPATAVWFRKRVVSPLRREHRNGWAICCKAWHITKFWCWLALQGVLFWYTSLYFLNVIVIGWNIIEGVTDWSYGQLVAVMVWAPTVGKYIYFNLFGIEEGFGRRLAKHYRVVHDRDESSDEDDSWDQEDAQNGVHVLPTQREHVGSSQDTLTPPSPSPSASTSGSFGGISTEKVNIIEDLRERDAGSIYSVDIHVADGGRGPNTTSPV